VTESLPPQVNTKPIDPSWDPEPIAATDAELESFTAADSDDEQPKDGPAPISKVFVLLNNQLAKHVWNNPLDASEEQQLEEAFADVERHYAPQLDGPTWLWIRLSTTVAAIHGPRAALSRRSKAAAAAEEKGPTF
jgi:hypothetical protein